MNGATRRGKGGPSGFSLSRGKNRACKGQIGASSYSKICKKKNREQSCDENKKRRQGEESGMKVKGGIDLKRDIGSDSII